jgi:peptide/nickel transport system substrate-binding protein
MGTGAFRLEAGGAGGPAVLVRNAEWWGLERWPHPIDRIVWTPNPNGRERAAALLRGDVDLAQDLPHDEADGLRSAPGVRLAEIPELRIHYLGFNQGVDTLPGSDVRGRNPFRDRRVREAVYHATDTDELIARAEAGLAVPSGMLATPGINGWSEELDRRLPHDPAAAKALLAEAGYPDGFAVPLLCQASLETACRIVAGQLARVGVRAEPDIHPDAEFFALMDEGRAGFWFQSVGNTSFDSQYIFRGFYHTGGWSEAQGYATPELDAEVDTIDAELSSPIRDALIERVWRRVLSDVVVVPLYRRKSLVGTRDWLEVPVSGQTIPYFREARLTGPTAH